MSTGSIDRRFTAPALAAERANCDFDQEELTQMLFGCPEVIGYRREFYRLVDANPEIMQNSFAFRELSG